MQTKIHSNRAYHIYNRGVSKHKIFKRDADYKYFIFRIAYYKFKYKIDFEIFCIMPNHYHFLINVGNNPANVAIFMQCIQLTYARYYNREYKHAGHVFESTYKRKHIENEAHYKYIYNYILFNPVEANLVKTPEEWAYTKFTNQKTFSDKGLR